MQSITDTNPSSNLVTLNSWLTSLGVQPITAYRWRRKGWIPTVNICGRVYVSRDTIADFERRAAAGEFAKAHPSPTRANKGDGLDAALKGLAL